MLIGYVAYKKSLTEDPVMKARYDLCLAAPTAPAGPSPRTPALPPPTPALPPSSITPAPPPPFSGRGRGKKAATPSALKIIPSDAKMIPSAVPASAESMSASPAEERLQALLDESVLKEAELRKSLKDEVFIAVFYYHLFLFYHPAGEEKKTSKTAELRKNLQTSAIRRRLI
jgi:hypothetical protein